MNTLLRCAVLTSLVLSVAAGNGDVCVYKPPKVKRVCGVVVDPSGVGIANANVTLLKDGATVEEMETDELGEFDFDLQQPGRFDINITANGFGSGHYQLTLTKAGKSCKHAMRIELFVGGLSTCGGDIRETKRPLPDKTK